MHAPRYPFRFANEAVADAPVVRQFELNDLERAHPVRLTGLFFVTMCWIKPWELFYFRIWCHYSKGPCVEALAASPLHSNRSTFTGQIPVLGGRIERG